MFLTADLVHMGTLDGAILALMGYVVVFFGLILLMIVVIALGKAFTAKDRKKTVAQAEAAPAPEPAPETPKPTAPGAAGQLKLNNVDPRTAAMLMAIVADKLQKPLNELRFISIKEVE